MLLGRWLDVSTLLTLPNKVSIQLLRFKIMRHGLLHACGCLVLKRQRNTQASKLVCRMLEVLLMSTAAAREHRSIYP